MCKEPERASDSPGTRVTGGCEQPTEEDSNPLLFKSTAGHLSARNNHFQSGHGSRQHRGSDREARSCSSIGTPNCCPQSIPCSLG